MLQPYQQKVLLHFDYWRNLNILRDKLSLYFNWIKEVEFNLYGHKQTVFHICTSDQIIFLL